LPPIERNPTSEQRTRPKSSIIASATRTSSNTRVSTASASSRVKSSKLTKSEKKLVELPSVPKKKSHERDSRHHRTTAIENKRSDSAKESEIQLVDDDDELEDAGKKSHETFEYRDVRAGSDSVKSDEDEDDQDDEDEDDDDDDEDHDQRLKRTLNSNTLIPSINDDQVMVSQTQVYHLTHIRSSSAMQKI
jgi:hypothetical protein